jgi:hypothetical protein
VNINLHVRRKLTVGRGCVVQLTLHFEGTYFLPVHTNSLPVHNYCLPVHTYCLPIQPTVYQFNLLSTSSTYCLPVNTNCLPVHNYCLPVHTYCLPVHNYCLPVHTYCRPVYTYCLPVQPTVTHYHTELRTLCSRCWGCCYVSGVYDPWLYFKT